MSFRPIRSMRELVVGPLPGNNDLGRKPELRWVHPTSLLVDETYQRDLTTRSKRLIPKLVKGFSWRKFKPPIVVEVDDGLHCIDGQHTAIAAATRGIESIPVFVIEASSIEERAESFVAHNKDRVELTNLQIFQARVAAREEAALDVVSVCKRAGVHLRHISIQTRVDVGDTACVAKILGLVKRQGALKSRMVLESLVKGGRAPISAPEIDATEAVMCLLRPATTVEEMATVVRALSDAGLVQARLDAAQQEKPIKHVLFNRYLNLLERQTGVPRAIAS